MELFPQPAQYATEHDHVGELNQLKNQNPDSVVPEGVFYPVSDCSHLKKAGGTPATRLPIIMMVVLMLEMDSVNLLRPGAASVDQSKTSISPRGRDELCHGGLVSQFPGDDGNVERY